MHSSIHLFLFFSFIVLSLNPKYMRPLLLSSSFETKLFDLHSLPHGCLAFLGDSHFRNGEIILTNEGMQTDAPRSAGVALYNHLISSRDPNLKKVPSFHTRFAFSIENRHGEEDAFGDGLAFLISPASDLLGSPGYLGLVNSTDQTRNKFIAIEFDTRCDPMFHDPDDNHVGLDINSLFSVKIAKSSSLGVNLKNDDLVITWIDYKANEKRLEVFLSDSYSKPKKPILSAGIDLSDYLNENMYVGFSAATKRSMQLIRVQQWEFTLLEFSSPPPPSPPQPGMAFPNPSESRHSHLSRLAIGLSVGLCSVPFVVLFCGFCWKKLMEMIQKSEGTNNVAMQGIRSSAEIYSHEIQLSILVAELARALNIEKVLDSHVLDNQVELTHVKKEKSSTPICNSLPAVNPDVLLTCNGLPLRTNDVTSV